MALDLRGALNSPSNAPQSPPAAAGAGLQTTTLQHIGVQRWGHHQLLRLWPRNSCSPASLPQVRKEFISPVSSSEGAGMLPCLCSSGRTWFPKNKLSFQIKMEKNLWNESGWPWYSLVHNLCLKAYPLQRSSANTFSLHF